MSFEPDFAKIHEKLVQKWQDYCEMKYQNTTSEYCSDEEINVEKTIRSMCVHEAITASRRMLEEYHKLLWEELKKRNIVD